VHWFLITNQKSQSSKRLVHRRSLEMKNLFMIMALILTGAISGLYAQEPGPNSDAVAAPVFPESNTDTLYEITTTDGQTLSGFILNQTDSTITLKLQSLGKMTLERQSVESIKAQNNMYRSETGKLWHRDPNRTRYLYSPSAMMLRRGEGNFSQKELFFSALGYGVTDYLNVQVGSAVPFWFAPGGEGFNFILGLKVGAPLSKKITVAAGIQTFFIPSANGSMNMPFGAITVGDDKAHFTFSASSPFLMGTSESGFGELLWMAFSGNLRLSKRVALVSENWVFKLKSTDVNTEPVFSLATRIFGDKIAVDVGAFFVQGAGIPIPWLDFTINFGN